MGMGTDEAGIGLGLEEILGVAAIVAAGSALTDRELRRRMQRALVPVRARASAAYSAGQLGVAAEFYEAIAHAYACAGLMGESDTFARRAVEVRERAREQKGDW